jgi:hypothetical protein
MTVFTSHAVPLLISLLIGALLALITWGVARVRAHDAVYAEAEAHDGLLLGLLVFAVFTVGVFLTYALFDLGI